jgi:hypothetical protein
VMAKLGFGIGIILSASGVVFSWMSWRDAPASPVSAVTLSFCGFAVGVVVALWFATLYGTGGGGRA